MSPDRVLIGIDLGGTKVAGAVVRMARPPSGERALGGAAPPEILTRTTWPTETRSAAGCVAQLQRMIADLTAAAGGEVGGIGLGVASMVDHASGSAVESVNLPLTDVPLRDLLERQFGVPVAVDNDATAAAVGEHAFGAGVGVAEMLMLTLGTGIGGGIILGGRPYRGVSGAAAELGHVTVDVDGPACPANCPNRGCLEAYASGTALSAAAVAEARARPSSRLGAALAVGEPVDSRLLVRLGAEGDPHARAVLARAGEYLGAGLVTLVNVFNPELVVVGGGAAAAGELLLAPARRMLAARALRPARDQVRVVPGALGPDAGVFGAAALASAGW